MSDLRTMEALGNRNLKNTVRSHTAKRGTAIVAVVAAHLVCGGIVTSVANAAGVGLASVVTVSVNGTTGQWTPGGTSATASATAVDPTPEQQVPTAPSTPETSRTTSSTVGTPPVHEPETSGEPAPTTDP